MRKRVDHDATQEVSSSMLVPDKKPPVYPNLPKNDASMWMSAPVSADDFASGPKKKPEAPRRRGLVIGVTAIALLAVTGGGVWYAFLREQPKQMSAFEPKPAPAPQPAVASATVDAGMAIAAADAALAAAVVDAGAPTTGAALAVDAVSGADPAVKKAAKKRATKKKVVKKKTATAPKKRR